MRTLRYSINVTLDGCCHHLAMPPTEGTHRHATNSLARADALLFGRVTYQMMEEAWRLSALTKEAMASMPDWMRPFAETIDAAKKYVVSSTLDGVDWNAELVQGDLAQAIAELKRQPGGEILTGGVQLPYALAELGLIDEYEFVVQPRVAGDGLRLLDGLSTPLDLELVDQVTFDDAVAMRYVPRR